MQRCGLICHQLRQGKLAGMAAFTDTFKPTRTLLVGGDGIELETFLHQPATYWLKI